VGVNSERQTGKEMEDNRGNFKMSSQHSLAENEKKHTIKHYLAQPRIKYGISANIKQELQATQSESAAIG
jgi:hypothetical protein